MKIRLHGIKEENTKFLEELRKIETIKMLSVSDSYKDRGNSCFERIYIDCSLESKSEWLKNIFNGNLLFYSEKQAIMNFIEMFELGAQFKANDNKFYYEFADVQGLIQGIKMLLKD